MSKNIRTLKAEREKILERIDFLRSADGPVIGPLAKQCEEISREILILESQEAHEPDSELVLV